MARFIRQPLRLLDGIYRFVGGIGAGRNVDLDSDITLVHDVSRHAERDGLGGNNGYIWWQDQVAVNGAEETVITRLVDVGPVLQVDTDDYELWVLHASLSCSASDLADFTEASLNRIFDTTTGPVGTPVGHNMIGGRVMDSDPIWYIDTLRRTMAGNTSVRYGASSTSSMPRPVRIGPAEGIGWAFMTAAAATLYTTVQMWAGPLGSTPPGVV